MLVSCARIGLSKLDDVSVAEDRDISQRRISRVELDEKRVRFEPGEDECDGKERGSIANDARALVWPLSLWIGVEVVRSQIMIVESAAPEMSMGFPSREVARRHLRKSVCAVNFCTLLSPESLWRGMPYIVLSQLPVKSVFVMGQIVKQVNGAALWSKTLVTWRLCGIACQGHDRLPSSKDVLTHFQIDTLDLSGSLGYVNGILVERVGNCCENFRRQLDRISILVLRLCCLAFGCCDGFGRLEVVSRVVRS